MKRTWKQIGSLFVVVCMVLTMLPAVVFAEIQDYGAPLGVSGISPMGSGAVTGQLFIGGVSVVPDLTQDGIGTGWEWDASTATLILDSSYPKGDGIEFSSQTGEIINIELSGNVEINPAEGRALNIIDGGLTIKADSYTLTAASSASTSITAEGNVVIESGTIVAQASNGGSAITVNSNITVRGNAHITATAVQGSASFPGNGINASSGIITIEGGMVLAEGWRGVACGKSIEISGGSVTATGVGTSSKAISATMGTNITRGTLTTNNDEGKNGDVSGNLTVSGETTTVTVNGTVSGNLTVSGGSVAVSGSVGGTTTHTGGTLNGTTEITGFSAIPNVNAGAAGSATYANAEAVIEALPTSVMADYSGGTVSWPVTTWVDTDGYNPATAGSYTFTAALGTAPYRYANSGDHTATIEVVVSASGITDVTDSFTDPNFLAAVRAGLNMTNDERLYKAELAGVETLNVSNKGIKDLAGIEHFSGLLYLYCSRNELEELDVSGNPLLLELYCYDNKLTSLDVGDNAELLKLICYDNKLTSLDVSDNTELTWLQCNNNQLKTLTINNSDLTFLNCAYNELETLKVDASPALKELYCHRNQLKTLDVSGNSDLEFLDCTRNDIPNEDAVTGRKAGLNFTFRPQNIDRPASPIITDAYRLNDDGTYCNGEELWLAVEFSERVWVNSTDGTPYINLQIGSETKPAYCDFQGTDETLYFFYTIESDDLDADGIECHSPIELNGGIIRLWDPDFDDVNVELTFTPPADTSGILVNGSLPRPTFSISGTVKDEETGHGIPGATVDLYLEYTDLTTGNYDLKLDDTIVADASGNYTFDGVSSYANYVVEARAEGYEEREYDYVVVNMGRADGTAKDIELRRIGDNGDDTGGNGGGSSPGGSTTTPPPATPPATPTPSVSGSTATTTVTTTTDTDGKAVASVPAAQVNSALKQAQAAAAKSGKAPKVEIKVEAPTNATAVRTAVPQVAMAAIASGNLQDMTISSPVANLTFDGAALNTIAGAAAGDVSFSASRVDTASLPAAVQTLIGNRPVYEFSVTSGGNTISQFGGNVTVAVPYQLGAGEDPNAVIISFINADGNLEIVTNGRYAAATGTVVFTTDHFSRYAIGYKKINFTDVADSAWYVDAVTFLAARGITGGTTESTFSPDATLTRGQFITLLMRAYDMASDEKMENNFSDAGNTFYTGYLAAAKRLGITGGVGDNKFAPEQAITRQEMFTMLYNTLKSLDKLPAGDSGKTLADFTDSGDVETWATIAITALVKSGTVTGSGGKLDPTVGSTRAQMAQVLYNLLGK